MKYFILLLSLIASFSSVAQKALNETYNGKRIGDWEIRNTKGYLVAKGEYEDGLRIGDWSFYIHPTAQYTETPDVVGYFELGVMQGIWKFRDVEKGTQCEGEFRDGLMSGTWIYTNEEGEYLARGGFVDGIRSGKWILYKLGKPAIIGKFDNGQKVGKWIHDYYNRSQTLHFVAEFDYKAGQANGILNVSKIQQTSFGKKELLIGRGRYVYGQKQGRWIEYETGGKGSKLSRGDYDNNKRHEFWTIDINEVLSEEIIYNYGEKDGLYRSYHSNGQLAYETYYKDGLQSGPFKSWYENGNVKAKGSYTISTAQNADTIYYMIKLPYEYAFKIIQQDKFETLNYDALAWISTPDFSANPAEIENRYTQFLEYGDALRIAQLKPNKRSVRVGAYKAYYEDDYGIKNNLKEEGEYYPALVETYDEKEKMHVINYARQGIWKFYDTYGEVQYIREYDKGKLIREEKQ